MPQATHTIPEEILNGFQLRGNLFAYRELAAKLFNFCLSKGMQPGQIVPSRAFCSDESQGFPILMLAKHFGGFPFDHGRVGGTVATGRHGPHAHHGEDMVIVQASHVGFDPQSGEFGQFRRLQTKDGRASSNCGKIVGTLAPYQADLDFARSHIWLEIVDGQKTVLVDRSLVSGGTPKKGLCIVVEQVSASGLIPIETLSHALRFPAGESFVERVGAAHWQAGQRVEIGESLPAACFFFTGHLGQKRETGKFQLERNIIPAMPDILTHTAPALAAAVVNTQAEFDRAYRSIETEPEYQGKRLLFAAGLNIDISPHAHIDFPLVMFVPWAAYWHAENGDKEIIEQAELVAALQAQSAENPHAMQIDKAVRIRSGAEDVLAQFNPAGEG